MAEYVLGDRLSETLGGQFVTRHSHADGILFRGPDPKNLGERLDLLITSEAWKNCEPELSEAAERAIALLREFGGAAVIREGQAGELVVDRGM